MGRCSHAVGLAIALLLLGCSSGGDSGGTPAANDPSPPGGADPPPPDDGGGAPPPPDPVEVSALFVLGDSLSDVGNAAALADYLLGRPISPPTVGLCNPSDVLVVPRPCDDLFYRQSRVSDGSVAVEHLAARFGLAELVPSYHIVPSRPDAGTDYAVASAKARGPEPEDLATQADMLLLDHAPLPADALYVVMIGGNDAIDALQAAVAGGSMPAQTSAAIVTSAVAAIGANVERLLDFGARRIVVANVPHLATLPAVLSNAQASGDAAAVLAAASSISEAFDGELAARLEQIASSTQWNAPTPPVIMRFDLRSAVEAAQHTAIGDGGNAVDACFDSDTYRQSSTAERVFHPECEPAAGSPPRFADFVFWDGIHPTGAAHAAIGAALGEQVAAELELQPQS